MSTLKQHQVTGIIFAFLIAISVPCQSLAADIAVEPAQITKISQATFPPLELANSEIENLNKKIATIEADYEKKLIETRKLVNRHYSEKLDAQKNEQRDKFEASSEFKARQKKDREDLMEQRDAALAGLNAEKITAKETDPLKARIKELNEHEYSVGDEGIQAELGLYVEKHHLIPIKLRGKYSQFKLKLDGTIPLQEEAAKVFNAQWQKGLIRPVAKATISGELIELVLINNADNSRWVVLKEQFFSLSTLNTLSADTLNNLFPIGSAFKDCATCPNMIVVPAGSFEMGTNDGDEKPIHRVNIGLPFAMGKTEVTQGEWKAVMGNNPSNFKNCGDNCPVEQVSWNDAKDFIQKLNDKTGKAYILPSEAEWEYACRAGGAYKFCGGDKVVEVAWYSKNSGDHPHSAAAKLTNAWGLYDMSGNVWEWVEDSYHTDYTGAPSDGTAWKGDGSQRVLRGGSWNVIPELVGATVRSVGATVLRDYYYGFRVARTLP